MKLRPTANKPVLKFILSISVFTSIRSINLRAHHSLVVRQYRNDWNTQKCDQIEHGLRFGNKYMYVNNMTSLQMARISLIDEVLDYQNNGRNIILYDFT